MYIVIFKRKPGPGGGVITSQTFDTKAHFDQSFRSPEYDDEDVHELDVTPKRAGELVRKHLAAA